MSNNVHPIFKPLLDSIAPTPTPRPLLMADAGVIRAALMDVIDGGWHCSDGCRLAHGWEFNSQDESDDETERREKFADRIQQRIRELQAPPHNLGIKLENLCDRHKRERLPAPTELICADCRAERKPRQG